MVEEEGVEEEEEEEEEEGEEEEEANIRNGEARADTETRDSLTKSNSSKLF